VPSFEQIFDRDEPFHLLIIARDPRVCTRAPDLRPRFSGDRFGLEDLAEADFLVRKLSLLSEIRTSDDLAAARRIHGRTDFSGGQPASGG
jgi:hypothetical protein